jgi:hypothetical protein
MNNKLLIGIALAGGLGLIWFLTRNNSPPSATDAVNPNAQIGAGATAQGTEPDIGNLLSYNQPVNYVGIIPQATNVDGSQYATPEAASS